jgi:N-acetylglucosaminyldiphosphoundecaprenol N-acetyl-beta-D-mannosaminyltransferase
MSRLEQEQPTATQAATGQVAEGPRRSPLFDVCVHEVNLNGAVDAVNGLIARGMPSHVVTLDASMCVAARRDLELRRIVLHAELVTPDSVGVLWAAKRKGIALTDRASGVEISERLCAASAARGTRIFFLGSAPGVAEDAAIRMRDRYPGCNIVGTMHGYYDAVEERNVLHAIRQAAPDVLLVAFGIPKQEKWIALHREALGVPVMIGVGGSLDVMSGRVERAPQWARRFNMEWLYRLAQNPKKIGKALALPRFVWMALTR